MAVAPLSPQCFKKRLFDAFRSDDSKGFKEIVDQFYDTCEPFLFDELLSEFYEEITLKGVRPSKTLNIFIQNRLIRTRLLEKAQKQKNDFSNVLQRVDFLIFLINDLNQHKQSPNGVFMYISKTIALNIHILKKQLSFSYNTLPWEEIEFCLVIYVAYCLGNDITLISGILLNHERILNHLIHFRDALQNEKSKFTESKTKFTNRNVIKTNILSIYAQFKSLYEDYEVLRDVYSLRRMQQYLYVVLSYEESEMIQFGIERTLQVIGEHLKNTPESPNISLDTEKRLLNSAPKHLKKILVSLRNMLSHSSVLEKKIFLGDNNEDIVNDLKKIYIEIVIILYEKLKDVCKGKNVTIDVGDADMKLFQTKESEKLREIIWKLKIKYPEDSSVYNKFHKSTFEKVMKLQKLYKELKLVGDASDCSNQEEDVKGPLRGFVESFSVFERLRNNPREQLLMMVEALDTQLFDSSNIKRIGDYQEILESSDERAKEKVEKICKNIEDALSNENEKKRFYRELESQKALHYAKMKILNSNDITSDQFLDMIKVFPSKVANNLEKMSIDTDITAIRAAVKVVSDAYGILLQTVASDTIISLKNYRNLLNKFCSTLKIKKDKVVDNLVDVFKGQIQAYFDLRWLQLLEVSNAAQMNEDLRMMSVEMLLLDLLEILMNTYCFVDNASYLDRPSPLLVGKNLRNYLAHGSALIDILPFDPCYSMATHCILFQEKCFDLQEGVAYGQTTNFDLKSFTEQYHKRLIIIDNQTAMFEAARMGNLRKVEECVKSNADPLALDINGESGLKCAAKANNVELLIYFLNQNVNEAVEGLLETAAENDCKSIIEYLLECNQQASVYVRSDNKLLHLATLNNNRSMVTYLLNIGK